MFHTGFGGVHAQQGGQDEVASAMAAEMSAVLSSTSAQTLTLGIDREGRILQHDRGAGELLADRPGALLGTDLRALIAGPGDAAEALNGLIDAIRADREATTVLTIRTASRSDVDAVVSAEPIRSNDPELFAQVILRIPPPAAERFIDPALMRHALLDGAVRRTGGALDIEQMAPELVNILVPHFCNAASLLILESVIGDPEHADANPGWQAAFPIGEILSFPVGTPHYQCLETAEPVSEVVDDNPVPDPASAWLRVPVARLLAGASILMLPLLAEDALLGFFACSRRQGFHRFDAYDIELGMEFARRAAMFLDSARRFSRERATATALQRSLLPSGLSYPASVQVRFGYLPGGTAIAVGGDWYESIELPGGRVALVVGDVAGHGVRAAVTMGRLRTAIRTLTMLELPAAETLQRLDDLMHELGQVEPHF